MNQKQKVAAIAVCVLIVGIIGFRFLTRTTAAAEPPDQTVPTAAVVLVKRGLVANSITLAGAFRAYQQVDVHAKVAGYVRRIYVDVGDHVKAGQTLAVLEVPELSAEVAGAKAGLRRAQDGVTRAQSNVHSTESIHAAYHSAYTRLKQASQARSGLIAEQELDDAMAKDKDSEAKIESDKAALAEAQSQLAVAQAELERMTAMEDYTHVTAPFAGVVTKRYADTGTMIQAGTSSDTQSLPVVQRRKDCALRRCALNDETRTMHTEIDVKNPDGALKEGMYAETQLILKQRPEALTVPIQALDRNTGGAMVLIVDAQGRIEKRELKLGVESSDRVEVVSGLAENDKVIVGSRSGFHEGEKVQLKVVDNGRGSEATL